MNTSRVLLIGLVATNKVAGRASGLLGRTLTKLRALAKESQHFEVAKAAIVQIATPVLGAPVVRQLGASTDDAELSERIERFAVENCVAAGVESGDISDALWDEAAPPEVQVLLPTSDVIALLVDDTSNWWTDVANKRHLAEVVDGLLEADPKLSGDLVNAADLDANFEKMAADPELRPRLATFCAGLRAGVRNSDAFDAKLLTTFTVAELVRFANPNEVWDFCKLGLQAAARAVVTKTESPAPTLVTCAGCGSRATVGTKNCVDCGQPFTATAAVPATTASPA